MTENRFADCRIVEQVIDRYATQVGRFGTISESLAFRTEAAARIRELTPPPVVSEEARERARAEARKWWDEPCGHDPSSYNHPDALADRIIDALGYTPPRDVEIDDPVKMRAAFDPAPPPVVDLAPDELRWLAAVVEDYEKLFIDASQVVDIDTLPPFLELRLPDAGLYAKVVCGENCWVLRIGGTDE